MLEGADLDEYYVSGIDDEPADWDDIDLDDVALLEPLGVQAVRSKLESDGLLVPVLPSTDQMTADDLVVVFMHGKHARDKATAKAARRAAYKASTRRAARR